MRSYRNVWFHTKRYDVATSRGLAQKVGVGVLFWLKQWGWVYCSENQIKAVKGNQRYCLRNVMWIRVSAAQSELALPSAYEDSNCWLKYFLGRNNTPLPNFLCTLVKNTTSLLFFFIKLDLKPKKLQRIWLAHCYSSRFCLVPPIPRADSIFRSTHLHIQCHGVLCFQHSLPKA
jgi:hypothetical protein